MSEYFTSIDAHKASTAIYELGNMSKLSSSRIDVVQSLLPQGWSVDLQATKDVMDLANLDEVDLVETRVRTH